MENQQYTTALWNKILPNWSEKKKCKCVKITNT